MIRKKSGVIGAGGTCSLVIQFIIVLWPPFYNSAEPSWMGVPFFCWYQLLCVIIGAVLTAFVYFAIED